MSIDIHSLSLVGGVSKALGVQLVDIEGLPRVRQVLTRLNVQLVLQVLQLLLVFGPKERFDIATLLLVGFQDSSPLEKISFRICLCNPVLNVTATLHVYIDLADILADSFFLPGVGKLDGVGCLHNMERHLHQVVQGVRVHALARLDSASVGQGVWAELEPLARQSRRLTLCNLLVVLNDELGHPSVGVTLDLLTISRV